MKKTKPAKRPRGRPISDNPAALRIAFRVTAEQRERYTRAALLANLTLTAWIERALDKAGTK